jgi:hypothetical protein
MIWIIPPLYACDFILIARNTRKRIMKLAAWYGLDYTSFVCLKLVFKRMLRLQLAILC